MQSLIRINSIRDRAAALRVTVKDVCSAASPAVPDSTISRWLSGDSDPRFSVYEAYCGRLEAALDRLEAGELERLQDRARGQLAGARA